MIQSQINRNIRLDLADVRFLLSKAKKDLSFARDCRRYRSGRSLRNRGFAGAASAYCRRRPPGRGEARSRRRRHSTVADDSTAWLHSGDRIPTDPTMYRFYEMLQVYGTTLKAFQFMRSLAMALSARLTSNSTLRKWQTRKVANVRSFPCQMVNIAQTKPF